MIFQALDAHHEKVKATIACKLAAKCIFLCILCSLVDISPTRLFGGEKRLRDHSTIQGGNV